MPDDANARRLPARPQPSNSWIIKQPPHTPVKAFQRSVHKTIKALLSLIQVRVRREAESVARSLGSEDDFAWFEWEIP